MSYSVRIFDNMVVVNEILRRIYSHALATFWRQIFAVAVSRIFRLISIILHNGSCYSENIFCIRLMKTYFSAPLIKFYSGDLLFYGLERDAFIIFSLIGEEYFMTSLDL